MIKVSTISIRNYKEFKSIIIMHDGKTLVTLDNVSTANISRILFVFSLSEKIDHLYSG